MLKAGKKYAIHMNFCPTMLGILTNIDRDLHLLTFQLDGKYIDKLNNKNEAIIPIDKINIIEPQD